MWSLPPDPIAAPSLPRPPTAPHVFQDKWHDAVAQVPALPTDLGAQLAAAKAQLPEAAQGLADRVPADVWTRVQAAAGALPDYGAPTYVGLGVLALTLAVVVARGRGKPKGAMASTAGLQVHHTASPCRPCPPSPSVFWSNWTVPYSHVLSH